MEYGLDLSTSPAPTSEEEVLLRECPLDKRIRPTDLLGLAVSKRWELFRVERRDMRRQVLQTSFIVKLCKHIEESKKTRQARKRSRSLPMTSSIIAKITSSEPRTSGVTEKRTDESRANKSRKSSED